MLDVQHHLSDRDRSVLDFEGSWWLYPGPKDRAIREYLNMSSTRYYQALRRLVSDPDALSYAPLVVRRLRRLSERRLATAGTVSSPGDRTG